LSAGRVVQSDIGLDNDDHETTETLSTTTRPQSLALEKPPQPQTPTPTQYSPF